MKAIFEMISLYILPVMLGFILIFGLIKKVEIYDTFIDGAKEGFSVGVKIIPYLIAILVAVGMFRAAGGIELLSQICSPFLNKIGMPTELLPLALIRPLSGSGALGIMSEIASEHGGNAFITKMAALMVGSSETTFYVLTVYFGSVGIKKFRHALLAGLIADGVSILAVLAISYIIF